MYRADTQQRNKKKAQQPAAVHLRRAIQAVLHTPQAKVALFPQAQLAAHRCNLRELTQKVEDSSGTAPVHARDCDFVHRLWRIFWRCIGGGLKPSRLGSITESIEGGDPFRP